VIAGAWTSLLMLQMIDNQSYDGKLKNLKIEKSKSLIKECVKDLDE